MVSSLTYRTADETRWGGGNGSNLTPVQVDLNFWTLFSAMQGLEDALADGVGAGIDYINQPAGGNTFYVHLTDHRVLGPFVIPTTEWTPRGEWAADQVYNAYDTVSYNGSLYLIPVAHTSGDTFEPGASDGAGHNLYLLLLTSPAGMIPEGGTAGQRLVKSTSSPFAMEWVSDYLRFSVFMEGTLASGQKLIQYPVTDSMLLPAGLIGSVMYQGTSPVDADAEFQIFRNDVYVGSIFYRVSPDTVDVAFDSDIVFAPGDLLGLVAPSTADSAQSDVSITLLATLLL